MMAAQTYNAVLLSDLLEEQVLASADIRADHRLLEISGLSLDSREVQPGDLFFAVKGALADGRDYITTAIANGAAAVIADCDEQWSQHTTVNNVPVIVIDQLARKISAIAASFYDRPSEKIPVIGVTGTNGKTSCAHLMMQLMQQLNRHCGVIGTLGVGVNGALEEGVNTTPDAITLQKTIADWLAEGVDSVVMEVSSHGLEQGRVAALKFDHAVFTNLTRDHLDYHGSMQAYAAAKQRLFQMPGLTSAVINADDDYAATLMQSVPEGVDCFTYSCDPASAKLEHIDVWVEQIAFREAGISALLKSPWGEFQLDSSLLGAFNLSNLLAVFIVAVREGFNPEQVIAAIPALKTVPGRMERVASDEDVVAVVDYAHTPDALEKALTAMRQHTQGDLWCVFGCGGDRDSGKRPQMGAIAQRYADQVVVTSDNPRHEDAAQIINEILGGIDRPTLVEEDRARAIEFAIASAKAGDSILVAGKGHEPYQQVGDQRIPFSDIQQVRLALKKREQARGAGDDVGA